MGHSHRRISLGAKGRATEFASKKRKPESNNTNGYGVANGAAPAADDKAILFDSTTKAWKIDPAVSFSIPQRKKLTLELVSGKGGGVRTIGASGSVEFSVAWKDVDISNVLSTCSRKRKAPAQFHRSPIPRRQREPTTENINLPLQNLS
ncbi:hypothetical protein BU24DRAFT_477073 [Aaosphaeria arxii CBS 175.79]|uniref:Uncharacterized protein n=1 Tax=Aaosphaeria arxii CBS 175.79 TaxID=1450172 RepID=A0A6A5Y557_9PLEO|nr:uncharacterized protein BU24DRAFT_477073 [Aaosphaeria arxii CBS 175.79]KAF2019981.1 hypothetical protein BU24DRAFT_477073 [Aaosphaeria arxii CBS 175.79]